MYLDISCLLALFYHLFSFHLLFLAILLASLLGLFFYLLGFNLGQVV